MENNTTTNLRYRFDVSTFRLLGRELISDRITALFELVKNCYDANAKNVTIRFENVNPLTDKSRIIIEDDGIGMSFTDLRDKWMVIGTSSKRRNKTSPEPFCRKVVGKKGVGRFAVDKLGSRLILKSKQVGSENWQCLETDWSIYANEEQRQLTDETNIKLFTEIDNRYWLEAAEVAKQGTRLEISGLADVWLEDDVIRAYKELSKLIRPNLSLEYPFSIRIQAPQYAAYADKPVETLAFSKATLSFTLSARYDEGQKLFIQQRLSYSNKTLKVIEVPALSFGPVTLSLNYYDKEGKARFTRIYTEDRIDGIKVYRDGLIATPFAEYKANRNEQKDLFGIDKRRWSDFFTRLSTRDLLGWVDITKEQNPNIIDSTNRQDFVDNKEWTDLKNFVLDQIFQIEQYLKYEKLAKREENQNKLDAATENLTEVKKKIEEIKQRAKLSSPELESELDNITQRLDFIKGNVTAGTQALAQVEEEKRMQANILYSLVSLQRYATRMSHIIKTSIGMIKRSAEFIAKWVKLGQKQEKCVEHAQIVYNDMMSLTKAIDFMLSYARDDSQFAPFGISNVMNTLFNEYYSDLFTAEKIRAELIVEEDIDLNYNQKAFEDMFGCLIDNSVKALKHTEDKRIRCSVKCADGNLIIHFSDNGVGIEDNIKEQIFDEFFTTTADLGGAGLGLFMVRTRLEAISASIVVDESEFKPTGATFKITIPLKVK